MFSWFSSVSNFYFTSQYHQFPLSHPAAAAVAPFLFWVEFQHRRLLLLWDIWLLLWDIWLLLWGIWLLLLLLSV
jgi:hypothetical protein